MCPCINNLVVTLVVGDESHVVVVNDFLHLFVTSIHQFIFLLRDDDIAKVERQTALEGHVVTQVLDIIKELAGTGHSTHLYHFRDKVTQGLLVDDIVNVAHFYWHTFVNHQTAYGGLLQYIYNISVLVKILYIYLYQGMEFHTVLIVGYGSLFWTVEHQTLALCTFAHLGYIVQTKHHILRRHCDRRSVGWVKNV